jgi:hypothetical protein
MHALLGAYRNDSKYSSAPEGLAATRYNGHAFWDVETWQVLLIDTAVRSVLTNLCMAVLSVLTILCVAVLSVLTILCMVVAYVACVLAGPGAGGTPVPHRDDGTSGRKCKAPRRLASRLQRSSGEGNGQVEYTHYALCTMHCAHYRAMHSHRPTALDGLRYPWESALAGVEQVSEHASCTEESN